jgi:hypothetical protein
MHTITRLKLAGAALALSLMLCAAADAKIVLATSIDGVKLGMTHGQVAKILGRGKQEDGDIYQYDYRRDTYQVGFMGSRVTSVETFDRHQRTSLGLGVGSTKATLKARQPGVRCTFDGMDESMDCYVGSIKRGHSYTDFFFDDSHTVTGVVVGEGYL